MLHRGHRNWTPYVDPHPDKENALSGLPLKTPIRHAALGGSKHHTVNGKASLLGGKQAAPFTGNGKAGTSQTVKGKEKEGGVEGKKMPMTVFKDRNLVLTGKKNGVSLRGSGQEGTPAEGDTFGIKKLDFKVAGTSTAGIKAKSKLSQQVSIPCPADDGFSALPQQTPFMARTQARASLGGVESTPLPSATRSRRRSRHSITPSRPSLGSEQPAQMESTPLPSRLSTKSGPSSARFPSSTSLSNLMAPTHLDKSFITPARPSYRAYLSPPDYEMDGEDEDISGRDESFEMGDMRSRMGALGVVDENEGEMMVDADVEVGGQMDAAVESDGEVEYMPPKVVPLPDEIPFDFVPLKTLGQQLNQIRSDFIIADSDSDEEAYPYVERLWSLDLGKQELLLGGWEGDEDVAPFAAREGAKRPGVKRLKLRPDTEFHNPLFAALKINQPRIANKGKQAAFSTTQTVRRPTTTTDRRPPSTLLSRPGCSTIPHQQRSIASASRTAPSTTAKLPLSTASRLPPSSGTTRQRLLPTSSATSRIAPTVRRPVPPTARQKSVTQRPTTGRPVLGQARANVRQQPTQEPLLQCEDIGFEL